MKESGDPSFDAVLSYLRSVRGVDLSGYKRTSLVRRAQRRLADTGVAGFADYLDYLQVHPEECSRLIESLLINVTSFFRDAAAWEHLRLALLPDLLSRKGADEPIRVWSAGCASGEEAFSVAILLAEALDPEDFRGRVKIYATDLDEDALRVARGASYDADSLKEMPPGLREKYFEPGSGRLVLRPDLRRAVIFGRHDLVQDAPISRLDLLVCRNVLMYFNAETQARVLARLHFALSEPGILFLGRAEMLLAHPNLFVPLDLRHRLFSRAAGALGRERRLVVASVGGPEGVETLGRHVRLREAAFDAGVHAQIVVDGGGRLALANQAARRQFGLLATDVGRSFQDLEVSYRPVELRSLIERALAERRPLGRVVAERARPDGSAQFVAVHVAPMTGVDGAPPAVSVVFEDVTDAHRLQQDLERSRQELETAYEELQSTNEELQTTNEELQSTVEELETTNEELQSTNEEMETMNEELQSTNTELQAINDELRERTQEAQTASGLLASIVSSLHSAVVALDTVLRVLVWSAHAEELFGLRAAETVGRPLAGLDVGLPVESVARAARLFLDGVEGLDAVRFVATNRRGKSFDCRITGTLLLDPDKSRRGIVLLIVEETP